MTQEKPRSPRFPFIPLTEAIELLRKLDVCQADKARPLKRPEILKALDYASFHGAAAKTIAAMRAYDLLHKQEDGIALSPVARTILDAQDEEEKLDALQRAALSPLCYRAIWRQARHGRMPEWKEFLLSRGFTEQGAQRAARIYRTNNELAQLQALELEPDLPQRGGKAARPDPQRKIAKKKRARLAERRAPGGGLRPQFAPESLTLPLSAGTAVIPKGITEEEFDTMMQTLRAWRSQLVNKQS